MFEPVTTTLFDRKILSWISGKASGDTANTESIFIPTALRVLSALSRALAKAFSQASSSI
jgi:hypothetical protein